MDLLQHMQTFVRIADAGSISRAAKGLRLSVAMTSRHLRALEEDLGVELVRRTTRRLALTEAGTTFLARSRSILTAASEARSEVRPGRGAAGRLVMSLPVSFGLSQLGPVFPALLQEHPRLELELRFEDRFVDLLADGVDLAVRAGAAPPDSPNVIARKLAVIDRVLCATPAFLAKHRIGSIEALSRVPCVVQGNNTRWVFERAPRTARSSRRASREATQAAPSSPTVVEVKGRLRTNSITALREAVLGSVGVGRLPLWVADADLESRRLVRVLPDEVLASLDVYGMFHVTSRGSAAIQAALDHLARELPRRTKMRAPETPR
jgi:DNA-binding transcriptional LysR family regulator